MNKIEKIILGEYDNLYHELNGTYDEEEQDEISKQFESLDKFYALVKGQNTIELEIIFHEDDDKCKIYNIHADEKDYYIEEYDGTCDEYDVDEFMEEAKLLDVTKEIDLFELLSKAKQEDAEIY